MFAKRKHSFAGSGGADAAHTVQRIVPGCARLLYVTLLALRFGEVSQGECVYPGVRLWVPVANRPGVLCRCCPHVAECLQGLACLVGEAGLG